MDYHDSEVFISKGKYVKILMDIKFFYVDKCKVVLDIDFNGITQSFKEDEFDKCIKVYHVNLKENLIILIRYLLTLFKSKSF